MASNFHRRRAKKTRDFESNSAASSVNISGYESTQRGTNTTKSDVFGDYANNPLFSYYWNTANAAQLWLRDHREYVRRSMTPTTSSASRTRRYPLPPPPPPPPLPPIFLARTRRKSTKIKTVQRSEKKPETVPKLMEMGVESEDAVSLSPADYQETEIEESEVKLDISEDVVAFMAQTIRHRIEREKKKAHEQEVMDQTVVFVPADRPFMASRFNEFGGDASAVAEMLLRQGDETKLSAAERKRQEMVNLYGNEAAGRLQAEETLMQMKFDQEYDKYHPPFWPNIPLKL